MLSIIYSMVGVDFKKVGTMFRKIKPVTNEEIPHTATVMTDHYFNDGFVDNVVNSMNVYTFNVEGKSPPLLFGR